MLRVLLFQYQEEQIPLQELEAICKADLLHRVTQPKPAKPAEFLYFFSIQTQNKQCRRPTLLRGAAALCCYNLCYGCSICFAVSECPFTVGEDGHFFAVLGGADDVGIRRADHDILMDGGIVQALASSSVRFILLPPLILVG